MKSPSSTNEKGPGFNARAYSLTNQHYETAHLSLGILTWTPFKYLTIHRGQYQQPSINPPNSGLSLPQLAQLVIPAPVEIPLFASKTKWFYRFRLKTYRVKLIYAITAKLNIIARRLDMGQVTTYLPTTETQ